ncbi:MAG: tetratricopeptide repeat protein [Clostridia bacterium]|nr:tetratricopeptide repeat protein [Clostridia bacterium]
MAKIIYKSNGKPEKKPRIYFTSHPEDFSRHFGRLSEDVYKSHDAVFYYTENMTEPLTEENKTLDIGRCNLVIVPVTLKLLTEENRALFEDIPYAKSQNIPVLPVMMESGLGVLYKKAFGESQYLDPYSTDSTAISYKEKLRRYLDSVLIGRELADRVRKAFDAYVFLSYRKIDRAYANTLMRLIHSNPECRDIAIWFDEFLTPGESFQENIENMLTDCDLFTVLVTPRILEKVQNDEGQTVDNYVVSTELPLAREKGRDILAVEMEKTDKGALHSIEIDSTVTVDGDFKEAFISSLSEIALAQNDSDPEHNFLIGLAYLEGIDVETDREKAVELITSAAENGLPEAMEKLCGMYENGVGVSLDYNESLRWAKALYGHHLEKSGQKSTDTIKAAQSLVAAYHYAGKHEEALGLIEEYYPIHEELFAETAPEMLEAIELLAYSYGAVGEKDKALTYSKRSYKLHVRAFGKQNIDTLVALSNLAAVYSENGAFDKALLIDKRVYGMRLDNLGERHPDTLNSLANLAATYGQTGDVGKMRELCQKAHTLLSEVSGEKHPHTLTVLSNLATAYKRCNRPEESLDAFEKAYRLRLEVLGREHPDAYHSLLALESEYDERNMQTERADLLLPYKKEENARLLIPLAYALYKSGRAEESIEVFKSAHRLISEEKGKESEDAMTLVNDIATACFVAEKYEDALWHFNRAHDLRKRRLSESHPDTLISLEGISNTQRMLEHYDKALDGYKKLIKAGFESKTPLMYTENIAYCYNMTEDYKTAAEWYSRLYEISRGSAEDEECALLNQAINLNEYGRRIPLVKPILDGVRILKRLRAMQVEAYGEESDKVNKTDGYLAILRKNVKDLSNN